MTPMQNTMMTVSQRSSESIFATYSDLISKNGFDWQTLSAISIISAELVAKYTKEKKEISDAFIAVNEMVGDFASAHAEEIYCYRLFQQNLHHWLYDIPLD